MSSPEPIPLPLPHVGSVNAWLLRGKPLTLIDTGPRSDEALAALEAGLRRRRPRVEDIELVSGTHHHHDHVGLAATIRRRSGADIAVIDRAADYARHYPEQVESDRRFAHELMDGHGMPAALLEPVDALWDYIKRTSEPFDADLRLSDGETILAGGRRLRALHRPGHSSSDTLFVDEQARLAFVGDHLLSGISPNTEVGPAPDPDLPRRRPRVDYLDGLRLTASMPARRMLTGHGAAIVSPRDVVERQLAQHRRRCRLVVGILDRAPASAYAIGRRIWDETTVSEQPLLVLWEVLGYLDLLLSAGIAAERRTEEGRWLYSLARREPPRPRTGGLSVAHAG